MLECLPIPALGRRRVRREEQGRETFLLLRPEDLIPEDHVLRLIHKYVDFSFIRAKVKHLYSHTGRPSVDPEVMMRMLVVGYLFGIISERRLCDEVRMHLGYRWFVGLSLEEPVLDHSTFSKNRHGRFQESGIYQEMFDAIVQQCIEKIRWRVRLGSFDIFNGERKAFKKANNQSLALCDSSLRVRALRKSGRFNDD